MFLFQNLSKASCCILNIFDLQSGAWSSPYLLSVIHYVFATWTFFTFLEHTQCPVQFGLHLFFPLPKSFA